MTSARSTDDEDDALRKLGDAERRRREAHLLTDEGHESYIDVSPQGEIQAAEREYQQAEAVAIAAGAGPGELGTWG